MSVAMEIVLEQIKKASMERIRIGLPGGSSALSLMDEIAQSDLDWSKIDLIPIDERAVSIDDPLSNSGLIQRRLLVNESGKKKKLCFIDGSDRSDFLVNKLNNNIVTNSYLTVAVLGMGEDGHIASLFPNQKFNSFSGGRAEAWMATPPAGIPATARISMTLTHLLKSKCVLLLLSNKKKVQLFEHIMAGNPQPLYPVSFIFHQDSCPVFIINPDGDLMMIKNKKEDD